MQRMETDVKTRAKVQSLVLALALSISVGACGLKSCFAGTTDESKSCDLARRLFETAGASSSEINDASIPGARLFRYKRNRDLTHASVVGCRPASGELLQPDDVFELLPHGAGSGQELAELYMWCSREDGEASNEIVTTAARFTALHGPSEAFTAPVNRLGVVAFWRAETDTRWHPEPSLYLQILDARTGLGRQSELWSDADRREDRTSLRLALADETRRGSAFFLLAYRPRFDLANELVVALAAAHDAERQYLGLMALRGEAGLYQVAPLARLAENDAPPLVRMGVVQTLATIPAADARPLAAAILERERDPRARRVMQAALKD
jgi:hypothetical protein